MSEVHAKHALRPSWERIVACLDVCLRHPEELPMRNNAVTS